MEKWHIGSNGPGRCTAVKRECPVGGEHFESEKEASKAYGKLQVTFPKISKNTTVNVTLGLVKLSSNFIETEVTDGDLSDPNARMALITGYCGNLAKTIIEKQGGTPVFLTFDYNANEESLLEDFKANPDTVMNTPHILVEVEDGVYIDAYGRRELDEVEEHFEGAVPVRGTMEMLDHWIGKAQAPNLSNFAESAIKLYETGDGYDYDDELEEFEFDDEEDYGEED